MYLLNKLFQKINCHITITSEFNTNIITNDFFKNYVCILSENFLIKDFLLEIFNKLDIEEDLLQLFLKNCEENSKKYSHIENKISDFGTKRKHWEMHNSLENFGEGSEFISKKKKEFNLNQNQSSTLENYFQKTNKEISFKNIKEKINQNMQNKSTNKDLNNNEYSNITPKSIFSNVNSIFNNHNNYSSIQISNPISSTILKKDGNIANECENSNLNPVVLSNFAQINTNLSSNLNTSQNHLMQEFNNLEKSNSLNSLNFNNLIKENTTKCLISSYQKSTNFTNTMSSGSASNSLMINNLSNFNQNFNNTSKLSSISLAQYQNHNINYTSVGGINNRLKNNIQKIHKMNKTKNNMITGNLKKKNKDKIIEKLFNKIQTKVQSNPEMNDESKFIY